MKKFKSLIILLFISFVFILQISTVYGDSTFKNFNYEEYDDYVSIIKYTGSENKVTIPKQINNKPVTEIGEFCMYYNSKVEEIIIPNSVKTIGKLAFSECSNLKSINIPSSVSNLSSDAFSKCENLTSLSVSSSNPYYTSSNQIIYNKLKTKLVLCAGGKTGKITIPSTITSIEPSAFSYCTKITSIILPSNLKTINEYAFSDCSSLTSITIPKSVTTIKQSAFVSCGLTSITIPATTINMENNIFPWCLSLTQINISSENPKFTSINGVVYSKDKKKILMYPVGRFGTFTIPSSVTSIGDEAFFSCRLSKINVPYGVTSIGEDAFIYSSNLQTINVPSSVKSIGDFAFMNCPSLLTITIPPSVTSFGYNLFGGCNDVIGDKLLNVKCAKDSPVHKYVLEDYFIINGKKEWNSSYTIFSTDKSNNIYTLTFNPNLGKLPSNTSSTKKVTTGKLVGTLPNPTRSGYIFKGWYTSKTGGSKVNSSSRYYYMSNKTLYARWEKVTLSRPSIKTLSTPATRQIKVTVYNVKNAKGYQISYSTSSKFTSSTTKKITTTSTSKVISSLLKNKTYYVKVRAYNLDSTNKKIYSSYSSVKSIKTK